MKKLHIISVKLIRGKTRQTLPTSKAKCDCSGKSIKGITKEKLVHFIKKKGWSYVIKILNDEMMQDGWIVTVRSIRPVEDHRPIRLPRPTTKIPKTTNPPVRPPRPTRPPTTQIPQTSNRSNQNYNPPQPINPIGSEQFFTIKIRTNEAGEEIQTVTSTMPFEEVIKKMLNHLHYWKPTHPTQKPTNISVTTIAKDSKPQGIIKDTTILSNAKPHVKNM